MQNPEKKTMRQEAKVVKTEAGVTLIIDDSEVARAAMVDILERSGMKTMTLSSPIGATRAVLRNNVDVVVIDVLMHGMRGDRLATLFRGNPRLLTLGLVLVSSENDDELNRLSAESGVDAIVAKSRIQDLPPAVTKARRLSAARRR